MTFLLENWKLVLVAVLMAAVGLFYELWQHEVHAYAEYRAQVVEMGKQAEIKAKEINEQHLKTVEDVSNAWTKSLPAVRSDAVRAYLAHAAVGLQPRPSGSGLSVNAGGAKIPDGTGKECVLDTRFIQDSAEDALKIQKWQDWAVENHLPIQ